MSGRKVCTDFDKKPRRIGYGYQPPLASRIIDPRRWKESDKVWATYYMDLFDAYDKEVENRITYQERCERLEKENKFLIKVVNSEK